MGHGRGHFLRGDRIDVLVLPALKTHGELDRAHVNAHRLGRFVVKKNLDGQDSNQQGIRLAELFLGAIGLGV